jgi:hypothetical protein
MFNALRRWHWTLLHRVFGLPDRNHTEPHAPLSAVLRSHPKVPAHGRHFAQRNNPGFRAQLKREMQRQPHVLKGWQKDIRNRIARQETGRHTQTNQHSEL